MPVAHDDPHQEERRKREHRAEKLRREYERVGREQNGIFESLAEYTHEVQAEVRALQITRDRISANEMAAAEAGEVAKLRIGSPIILGDMWISWELATLGVLVCAVIGVIIGTLRGAKRTDGSQRGGQERHRSVERPHHD